MSNQGVLFVPSEMKHTGRMQAIQKIILHDTAGLMDNNVDTIDGCLRWLTVYHPKPVSAHVLISRSGLVYRLVEDRDTAWHTRNHNSSSLGLEFERAKEDESEVWPKLQLEAGARIVAEWVMTWRIPLNRIYGHRDLDPGRRRDPRHFPWYGFLVDVSVNIAKIVVEENV